MTHQINFGVRYLRQLKQKNNRGEIIKTILLLHGWGHESYYNNPDHKNPWNGKEDFIRELKNIYNVHILLFPGFSKEKEPKKAYDLNDYAFYVNDYIKNNNLKIDYILGNSFGGEVAVRYKTLINNSIPLILTVPAIFRKSSNSKEFIRTPKFIKPIRNIFRDLYVIYIKKTPEMRYGTKFLRASYQNIVRYNLINEIKSFKKEEILIILGEYDDMVDTETINKELNSNYNIYKIKGGHEIAGTHIKETISLIKDFISKK